MSTTTTPPVTIADSDIPAEEKRRPRRRRAIRGSRPGWFVYGVLAIVLGGSLFPFYWSFLIGSGDASTIRDPNMSWLPGGNFIDNALAPRGRTEGTTDA